MFLNDTMLREKALKYHSKFPEGKLAISLTKPMETTEDLSLAYSPGVAEPCIEIQKNKANAYLYTAKPNIVAVISNGTAVLGLGDIGALASKPVMEGKSALFKKFSGVDSFDIEINEKSPEKLVSIISAISPSFGGINLEDIRAPECFYVEQELIKNLDIPVFHDDQHGTAIIAAAGIKNACEVQNKSISQCKIIVSGAGAGAIATLKMLELLGMKKENCFVFDSQGIINKSREKLNPYKAEYAQDVSFLNFDKALEGADIFIGLSKADLLSQNSVKGMAENPIIFALANPVPEILPELVKEVRADAIVATGRSDYPNQVNNVICFPFLFRGALDVQATKINDEMKMACVGAIADLAKEPTPKQVETIYGRNLVFGREYIIPTPFDPRLCKKIAKCVAQAAIKTGVAQKIIDMTEYDRIIDQRLSAC